MSSARHAVLRRWDHGRRRRSTDGTKAPNAAARRSHGVEHHDAPLAIVDVGADNKVGVFAAPTLRFKSLLELSNE